VSILCNLKKRTQERFLCGEGQGEWKLGGVGGACGAPVHFTRAFEYSWRYSCVSSLPVAVKGSTCTVL
jgi:hypothetical protein